MSILNVENLCTGYGKKEIVKDCTVTVDEGQMVGILGPNGCGKSTFIKALCKGLLYSGKVTLDGEDLRSLSEKEIARKCSYVPQRSGLSIDISVYEVVLMGFHPYLGILESPNKQMKAKAKNLIGQMGLDDYIDANYIELSEGQKRLCILARSLVADSKLLMMDEPDGALDFGIRNQVMKMVNQYVLDKNSGAFISMHDVNLALAYLDKVYLMKDGKIVDYILPKEDSKNVMEEKLSVLYGNVHLLEYKDANGREKYVMV